MRRGSVLGEMWGVCRLRVERKRERVVQCDLDNRGGEVVGLLFLVLEWEGELRVTL